MKYFKRLFCLPDNTPLDLGNVALFGNIVVIQHRNAGQFDTVRRDPRFLAAVAEAKDLFDTWTARQHSPA